MFDNYGNQRLIKWKQFRDQLEQGSDPFQQVVDLWCTAPLIGQYLDPYDQTVWPDPWRLILDDKFDNLSIALGMLYTVKLTTRFMDADCKIHMSIVPKDIEPHYFVSINDTDYLNRFYRRATTLIEHDNTDYRIIWQGKDLP